MFVWKMTPRELSGMNSQSLILTNVFSSGHHASGKIHRNFKRSPEGQ